MDNEENQIVLIPKGNSPEKIETSIDAFSQPLASLLKYVGLPTENILSPIEERRKVIYSLESTIEILPMDVREKSAYLSKFTVAISVGLFDGALNFLWDETINALRRLVSSFDLPYFLTVAGTMNSKYKNLSSEEDLTAIGDHDLLEICRRIGLINEINFQRLEHTNYLRNHASAAHPNEHSISGIEMLSLLEYCLKYAIMAKPDHSVIQIKQLFENIRTKTIPDEDFPVIGTDLLKQPQERIDDFFLSIFGLFTDPRANPGIKNNISKLVPHIWEATVEDTKYYVGSKYGLYRKNGDVDRKDAVQLFLETVNGERYKDEDSLTAELIEKLQNLKTVHFEWNNFYNEYPHARSIEASIPKSGIPDSIKRFFVKVICLCHVGNGRGIKNGVDERADRYYTKYVEEFTSGDIKEFLLLFNDPEFVIDFKYPIADRNLREMAKYFKTKTKDANVEKILDLIIAFPKGLLPNLALDAKYKDAARFIK